MTRGRQCSTSLVLCGLFLAMSARAQAHVEEIVVRERSDSLVGAADAASAGTVGAEQLEMRTLSRAGEVLETVPGVIVTQHSRRRKGEPVLPARLQPRS